MLPSVLFRAIDCCFLIAILHQPLLSPCLTGLNRFNLPVYGLSFPLPTLNLLRCHNRPKARYGMCSVALFLSHFQRLAVVHFRGAPIIPSTDDLETFCLRKTLKYNEYSCGFSQSECFNLINRWAL